jgi:hypothetical protein
MENDNNLFPNGGRPQYFGKRKTTSISWQMEDNLIIFVNRRRTQFFLYGRQPQFFLYLKDDLNLCSMEDDHNCFINGRRPQFVYKWKTTSIVLQMKDNLKWVRRWKMTSDLFLNGGRPESCQLRLGNTLIPA